MRLIRFFTLLMLTALLSGCGKPALYQQESYVFGTRVTLSIWGMPEAQAQQAANQSLAELDRLHAKLHAWRPSNVLHMNQAFAKGEAAPIDAELKAMLLQASDYAQRSDQLFNPAVGNLVALWGFHRDTFEPVTPDPAAIAAALKAQPSMEDLVFSETTVRSRNPAVAIDLGGFAKGWALDKLAQMLHERGIHNALINIGGNVMALGSKDGQAWKVGLQHPRKPTAMAMIELHDGEAIGTSGDYQRYFELNGKRYAHLIDPRTGQPAEGIEAATVLASAGTQAGAISDAASKPLFVGGVKSAAQYADKFAVKSILLIDTNGTVFASSAMLSRVVWLDKPAYIREIR